MDNFLLFVFTIFFSDDAIYLPRLYAPLSPMLSITSATASASGTNVDVTDYVRGQVSNGRVLNFVVPNFGLGSGAQLTVNYGGSI